MPVVPKDINKQVVFKAEQLLNLKQRTLVQQPFLKDSRTKDALASSTPTESSSLQGCNRRLQIVAHF